MTMTESTHRQAKASAVIELTDISKNFGGVKALSHINITLLPHTIHGLIGPNGAGKTTLFNIMTGFYQADSGQFKLMGKAVSLNASPQFFAERGIARTFQNIRLFKSMSVLENVMVGQHQQVKSSLFGAILKTKHCLQEEQRLKQKAIELLDYVGLKPESYLRVADTLSYGDQRRLEIARALALNPSIVALDEPAAGMNPTETEQLTQLIFQLKQDGKTVLLIEHDVGLMMSLCDEITVLNFGEKIAHGTPDDIRQNPAVIEAYLGKDAPEEA